jgi:hypothetical protein
MLPEGVLAKLFSYYGQVNKDDFAYCLKLKATWVAEGIDQVSRAMRAAKYEKPPLEAGPSPGKAGTETETEREELSKPAPA